MAAHPSCDTAAPGCYKFHQFPTSKLLSAGKERQYCRLMMALHIIRRGHRQDNGSCSLTLEACATCPSASPFVSDEPAKSKNSPSIHATTYETPEIRPTACITIMSTAAAAAEAETETVLPAPDHQPIQRCSFVELPNLSAAYKALRLPHFSPIQTNLITFSSCNHGVIQSQVCTCSRRNCHMSNFCGTGTRSSTRSGC